MAGNTHNLVKPKTATQDPLRIAAGSPLAIQGVFIEILRERFTENAGIGIIWRADPTTTDIFIEAGYNEETESRNNTPSIYITRLQSVPGKVIIGDRAGVSLPSHLEAFGALMTTTISIECVSNDQGESAILGDIIQFMLLASQDVIQDAFGFYSMEHPILGQTQPYERDTTKWSTNVEFQIQFWVRWSQVPIRPLLQQIAQKITNSNNKDHFKEVAISSLKRLDPSDNL